MALNTPFSWCNAEGDLLVFAIYMIFDELFVDFLVLFELIFMQERFNGPVICRD